MSKHYSLRPITLSIYLISKKEMTDLMTEAEVAAVYLGGGVEGSLRRSGAGCDI